MQNKRLSVLSVWMLTLGPVIVSAVFFVPWVKDLSTYNWMILEPPFRFLFSIVVPGSSGLILGWNHKRIGLVLNLLYVPSAMLASFLFAVGQCILDPVREGAAEFALVVWFYSLLLMVAIGIVFAFLGGGLALATRSVCPRTLNRFVREKK